MSGPAAAPIGPGAFVAVVGPSGAGKDTLIVFARDRLGGDPRFAFMRRVVTRASDAALEDHDSLTEHAFEAAHEAGSFALTWRAHGLSYGIPAAADAVVAAGGVAVANVSRQAVAALRARYARVLVVEVTAPSEVRAARLAARGRESEADIAARMKRGAESGARQPGSLAIVNDGAIADAGQMLLAAIIDAAGR